MSNKKQFFDNVRLGKLVHGGQCLTEAPDGRKLFVWGGLPQELVDVRVTKKKRSYLEGIVEQVHESSPDRIKPIEPETYLSSSPWQIMTFQAENSAKQAILHETFEREGLESIVWSDFYAGQQQFGYRNKVEFGFWGDDNGIHYAQYVRGTHGKHIISSNALAKQAITDVSTHFLSELKDWTQKNSLRAGDFKTVVFRCSEAGEVVAAIFMKQELDCSEFRLPRGLKGVDFYYSNPKSPASVPTTKLYSLGDITLADKVNGKNIIYDVMSFFQVNLEVFNIALQQITKHTKGLAVIDMYSGVGTIGVAVGASLLVESDKNNVAMAHKNINSSQKVIHASSETALEHITSSEAVIIDPPRAGLHMNVVQRILDVIPPKIIYLSCNPSTQARDIKLLASNYKITYAQGFNFFPRTPHIESLIVLEKT